MNSKFLNLLALVLSVCIVAGLAIGGLIYLAPSPPRNEPSAVATVLLLFFGFWITAFLSALSENSVPLEQRTVDYILALCLVGILTLFSTFCILLFLAIRHCLKALAEDARDRGGGEVER